MLEFSGSAGYRVRVRIRIRFSFSGANLNRKTPDGELLLKKPYKELKTSIQMQCIFLANMGTGILAQTVTIVHDIRTTFSRTEIINKKLNK